MFTQSAKSFPIPSIQRLPVYLRFLKEQRNRGNILISCTQIAEEFGQLSVQVRKDLAITGIAGRPKIGYRTNELIDAIENFLGWNRKIKAFLIGAGSLGSAILGYEGFVEHGLHIVAAFDVDPEKIGRAIHQCPVFDFQKMLEMGQNAGIEIGILTVPSAAAQEAANILVQIGVQGIWNYTPIRLDIPQEIVCEEVKLSASFAVLSSRLKKNAIFSDEYV
ncbi:MAG: redox-sensing transcriptional repressor Rex [Planctomycetaceae bacterium]|jgi:redox-sensing transcriptional repressor|nr:redox-sensing transcriptional repressor Rex [Planctomycetaceae bacterium]